MKRCIFKEGSEPQVHHYSPSYISLHTAYIPSFAPFSCFSFSKPQVNFFWLVLGCINKLLPPLGASGPVASNNNNQQQHSRVFVVFSWARRAGGVSEFRGFLFWRLLGRRHANVFVVFLHLEGASAFLRDSSYAAFFTCTQ